MRCRKSRQIIFVTSLFLLLKGGTYLYGQIRWDESGEKYNYDLLDKRFLILIADEFDYQETMVIKDFWESWGAKVDIASPKSEVTGHYWARTKTGWEPSKREKIKADLLLSKVDVSNYDALFFPGGNSPDNLLKADSLLLVKLIKEADQKNLVLGAICHGPKVLIVASMVKGKKLVSHRGLAEEIRQAGGEWVNEVWVADGNIVTGSWPYFETLAVKIAEKILYPQGGGPSESSPFLTNPVLKTIKERRSIRHFEPKPVDPEILKLILKAATWAPSANNDQPWKFVVVENESTKQKIQESLMSKMENLYLSAEIPLERMRVFWSNVFSAPVHIFVFCDTREIELDEGLEEIEKLTYMQSASAACENMLLAAKSLDLGSLWIGGVLIVENEIKTLLEIPEDVRLVAAIAIGYQTDTPLPPIRKPLSEVAFSEKWEGK